MKYSDKYVTVTVAGPKGSGKTLTIRLLKSALEKCGVETFGFDNEPDMLVFDHLDENQVQAILNATR